MISFTPGHIHNHSQFIVTVASLHHIPRSIIWKTGSEKVSAIGIPMIFRTAETGIWNKRRPSSIALHNCTNQKRSKNTVKTETSTHAQSWEKNYCRKVVCVLCCDVLCLRVSSRLWCVVWGLLCCDVGSASFCCGVPCCSWIQRSQNEHASR